MCVCRRVCMDLCVCGRVGGCVPSVQPPYTNQDKPQGPVLWSRHILFPVFLPPSSAPPPPQTSWRSWHTPQCCPHSEPSRLPIAFQMGSEVHSRLPSHCPSDELLGLCLCWWPCPRRSSTSISLARSWTCAGPWAVQAGASTAQCSWALRPVQWPGPDRGCKAGCRDRSALPGPGPPSRSAHPPAQPGKALSAPEVSFSGNLF